MNVRTLFLGLIFFASSYGMMPDQDPFEEFLEDLKGANSPSDLQELEREREETVAALAKEKLDLVALMAVSDPLEQKRIQAKIKRLGRMIGRFSNTPPVARIIQLRLVSSASPEPCEFDETPPTGLLRPVPTKSQN